MTSNPEHRRRAYLRDVHDTARILAQCDPLGLTGAGAPADEYAEEASEIVRRAHREVNDQDDLVAVVRAVLEEAFGQPIAASQELADVAAMIWRAMRSHGSTPGL